jgi:LacI family transcriptional regulator
MPRLVMYAHYSAPSAGAWRVDFKALLSPSGAPMAVRLKDIARELNVSLITVSKALRGLTDISDATRDRILKRMKELDYQPNMMARSLATGQSFMVGLIVPDLLNPFFTELAKSLGGALRKHSYGLILASSEDSPEIEQSEIRMMLARGVDALLLASCQTSLQGFYGMHHKNTPLVLVDRPFPLLRANFVGTDDYAGGKLATEHLIELGRRRLAYIGSPDLSPAAERFRGFRQALRERGIELREDLVLSGARGGLPADDAGYEMMQRLLKRRSRPNGVFCHNDVIAIGATKATLDAGLTIPGDIAFVGFDNVNYSKYLHIPLTSVDQSTAQLGETAAQVALDLFANNLVQPRNILLAPSLVVRQSSAGKTPREDLQTAAGPVAKPARRVAKKAGPAKKQRGRRALP